MAESCSLARVCLTPPSMARFGMMGWPVVLLSYAARQAQDGGLSDSMFVSVTLQLVYIAKFFLWESGYMCSIDIMHDKCVLRRVCASFRTHEPELTRLCVGPITALAGTCAGAA